MKIIQAFKRLHKWFALLVGIQLLLWIVSGIVFSFIDHKEVSGSFIFKKPYQEQLAPISTLVNFSAVIKEYPAAKSITHFKLLEQDVIKVSMPSEELLLDATSLELFFIKQSLIKQLVSASYQGDGIQQSIEMVSTRDEENRKFDLPVWKVGFDDQYGSSLYFSSITGEYQGIRTDSWRINDFFFMLHFMDYGQRGDFNHPLIIFAALVLVFFSFSGLMLIYSSFSKQDFTKLINRVFWHKQILLKVIDKNGKKFTFKVGKNERLLDLLNANNIELDNICGGGGICGGCCVKLINVAGNEPSLDNLPEHDTLSKTELKEGFRLACQLSIESNTEILLPVEITKS
jgi:ferredoxin